MSATDALAVLKKVPLFAALDAEQIREVIKQTSIVHVEPGVEVFPDGAPGDSMYVVIVGEVEIVKIVPTGGSRVLATLGSRAVFGEMSLLTEAKRSAGARAKVKSSLLKIDRRSFLDRLGRNDLVALKMVSHLASIMAERLRMMDDEIVKLVAEHSGPDREGATTPLYDIAEAREKVMFQWKI